MRYVYLVRAGNDQYKIGVSRNVHKRISALQTSNINRVELVCAKRTTDDTTIERSLHRRMRQFSGTGGKEWFHLTADQAIEIAIEIMQVPDVDIAENIVQDLRTQIFKIIEAYETTLMERTRRLEAERKLFELAKIEDVKKPKKSSTVVDQESLRRDADRTEYARAVELVLAEQHASTSFLQRRMRIGYGKAARLIEQMEVDGLVTPLDGIRREVLDRGTQNTELSADSLG